MFPCYFIAFVLAGLWHGSTPNFIFYGMLHGIGVSANKAWELFLIDKRGRKGLKQYMASPTIRAISIFATWNFVSFTMLFFPGTVHEAFSIMHKFVRIMA